MGFDPGVDLRGGRSFSIFRGRGPGSFVGLPAVRRRAADRTVSHRHIVRSAVRAGVVAANKAAATPELRTAREILDARYASGEIGREDYEEMRMRLETP